MLKDRPAGQDRHSRVCPPLGVPRLSGGQSRLALSLASSIKTAPIKDIIYQNMHPYRLRSQGHARREHANAEPPPDRELRI
jgi:hypothetical protein